MSEQTKVNPMINAWHLIWIIPLSGAVGYMLAALCVASGRSKKNE